MTIKRVVGPGQQGPLFVTDRDGQRVTVRGLRALFIGYLISANYLDDAAWLVGKMEWHWGEDGFVVKKANEDKLTWRGRKE